MSKTNKQKIDEHLEKLGKDEFHKVEDLYKVNFVNWSGIIRENKQYYSDYIAEKLLKREELFKSRENKSARKKSYFVEGHDGVTKKITNRGEEIFAKSLLGHKLDYLGRVIDYQIPLKGSRSDDFGKIDLVSIDLNEDTSTAYLIELKMVDDDTETLLKAALEIKTYSHLIKKLKFRNELKGKVEKLFENHAFPKLDAESCTIKKAVLFAVDSYEQSALPQELWNENAENYKNLKKMINQYEIDIFTVKKTFPIVKTHSR